MGRLTIEQIIEHCEKTTKQYEEKVSDLFPVERIQSKTYWEHKQVAEYLKELQRYKDLEEQGRLKELPCAEGDAVWMVIDNRDFKRRMKDYCPSAEELPELNIVEHNFSLLLLSSIGKTVFLTKKRSKSQAP